jgi:hypothetical protein
MVSVSKLCCPVCWELFQVLKKEHTVRGCHPTVTPVVLPETLPNCVSEAMVVRFRIHAGNQLRRLLPTAMVSITGLGHRRNTSESGYSAASSNESAMEHSNETKTWTSLYHSVM